MKEFAEELFRTTSFKRMAFFVVSDFLLICFSMYASFWARFDGAIPPEYAAHLIKYCLFALVIKYFFLFVFGMYNFSWRFFNLQNLTRLIMAVGLSSFTLTVVFYVERVFGPFAYFPRAVLLLDFLVTLGLLGSLRIGKRAVRELLIRKHSRNKGGRRVLIIGAGAAGRQIAREMQSNPVSKYVPVGFVDDDPAKRGLSIEGAKVLGAREKIPTLMKEFQVDEALVAMPSASSKDILEILRLLRQSNGGKKVKILPSVIGLMDRNIALKDIQEIKVEDLLGRSPVTIDFGAIHRFLAGKRILVTGAAGSIGSELIRTVLEFSPAEVIALDIDETELFYLVNRVKLEGNAVIPIIGDIRDKPTIRSVFKTYNPKIVIDSAAYKHVPILERFAGEAVKTNVLATQGLAEMAIDYGVEKFVFISTDKAVNPTSVMGASKRIAEEILRMMNRRNGTKFVSVRFGNVLGSRGSVIPVFKEQIRRGGPVTVTHPDMKRYFMATAEAVLLVLEAAAAGNGGEVFILNMGEPVKIEDLAKEMIRLYGYEPGVDIPIIYTGVRPGEKLFEELFGQTETEKMNFEKIYKVIPNQSLGESELLYTAS